jgi:hypothetical protein
MFASLRFALPRLTAPGCQVSLALAGWGIILPCGDSRLWLVGVRVELLWVRLSLDDAARSQEALLVCFRPNLLADASVIAKRLGKG